MAIFIVRSVCPAYTHFGKYYREEILEAACTSKKAAERYIESLHLHGYRQIEMFESPLTKEQFDLGLDSYTADWYENAKAKIISLGVSSYMTREIFQGILKYGRDRSVIKKWLLRSKTPTFKDVEEILDILF